MSPIEQSEGKVKYYFQVQNTIFDPMQYYFRKNEVGRSVSAGINLGRAIAGFPQWNNKLAQFWEIHGRVVAQKQSSSRDFQPCLREKKK